MKAEVCENVDINYLSTDEQAVAYWVYKNKKYAGVGTDTLPGANASYIPVQNSNNIFAIVGMGINSEKIEPFERSILNAMSNEMAFAIEKLILNTVITIPSFYINTIADII